MKKALAICSALALVAGAAFADDAPALKLSGYLDTGVTLTQTDADGDDGAVTLYADDAGKDDYRFNLNGSYTDGDAGVTFRLRVQNDFNSDASPNFADGYVYAWGTFADGLVKVKAGKVDDGSWATKGDAGYDFADGKGLQVQVMPVKGLNLGAKLDLVADTATINEFVGETAFAGAYSNDMFGFQAGYKFDTYVDGSSNEEAAAYVGLDIKAVPNLGAQFEAKFFDIGMDSELQTQELCETFSYTVSDPLSLGLVCYQELSGDSDVKIEMTFNPSVSYVLNDKITLGLSGYYGTQEDVYDSEIYVKPSLSYAISEKATIFSYYKYDMYTSAVDGVDPVNTSTVNLEFMYSF